MKAIRLMLLTAWLGTTAAALSAATPQPETYTVVGYYKGEKPSPALFEKATAAVAQKVAGMTQTTGRDKADHRVEVLFAKGKFEIYVDAPPLLSEDFIDPPFPAPSGDSMERADSDRSQSR